MKQYFFALTVALSLLSSSVWAGINAPKSAKIFRTQGQQLITPNGQPIILKGTNLGNWLVPEGYMFKTGKVSSPAKIDELFLQLIGPDSTERFWQQFLENYITYEDIKYLKKSGANHVRVPFHYKLFTNDLYMGTRNAGFKYLDKVIEWCKRENMYVLLDMHCAPGGQTGDNIDDSNGYPYLYFSESSQQLMSDIWVKIAKKYKNESIVIGYDIVNEPFAHYFLKDIKDYNHRLFLLYKRMIADIRKVDKSHAIFLNGSVWAGDFGVFESILDDNVVYEFHKYWFEVNQESVQQYLDFSKKHNVPIYIGETGENSDEWVKKFRILLDENKINWCYWPYKKMNNTAGIMNFEEPEDFNLISKFAESDRSSFEKIRENMPDRNKVQKALHLFLKNSLYQHNFQNKGYIDGLGFKVQ
ncbi:Aryl-phospho-beta-D-glucosidase BglC, GH1 family [Flexibacter flexilis DSM 6793]|uniref:Aryl-phospho-beta-D-glucosidase BglC, GH1 family n=1 Tax=Flexibacter flexilis DSM 6793 TaxID=927664 RepID=A0A1I1FZB8_9BACT|nr:cellulase family glycosylhydrolase [Flexibacter flexilis]SFC04949.1 Aryl-phospho-beta-D-glucosidase BglC, GH1 family [Flexibacter flexilis DSM 6793]